MIFFIFSFFAVHSPAVVERVSLLCSSAPDVSLAFNLNGEYVFNDPAFVKLVVNIIKR